MNFFREADNSKFMGRKWFTTNDQSKAIYDPGNTIIYNTSFKFNLYDYHDAYIL